MDAASSGGTGKTRNGPRLGTGDRSLADWICHEHLSSIDPLVRVEMTIVRAPREDRFTTLNRSVINDDRLSFRAMGLLTFILDKPDGWRITSTDLARGEGREGRDAVRTALSELESAGYLRRERTRNADGTFGTNSTVFESPQEVATGAGEPGPGNPASVPQASITNTGSTTESNTEDLEDSLRSPSAATAAPSKPTLCKAQRDDLYKAIVAACGMEYGEMTKRQQRSCAVAMSELAEVGATPDEVHRRASIYPQKYHTVLTPNALANQWAALRVEGPPPTAARANGVMDRVKARLAADKEQRPDNVVALRAVGE